MRSAAVAAGMALPYWAVSVAVVPGASVAFRRWVLYQGPEGRRVVALTFDDGPDPDYSERFLEALGSRPATFFSLGERVRRWPELARSLASAGHEVACHGDTHRALGAMGPGRARDELRRARDSITEVVERPPRFYRPAYGVFILPAWIEAPRLGMRRTLWSTWARDWAADATPDLIASRTLGGAEPGAILLLHDSDGSPGAPERTLRALPRILDGIEERGLDLVTLSDLVG
jgi:peptidoglycan/xylan/chitin deacetylase (PgdA/CDA1 family)